jgi:hypothetical protein
LIEEELESRAVDEDIAREMKQRDPLQPRSEQAGYDACNTENERQRMSTLI